MLSENTVLFDHADLAQLHDAAEHVSNFIDLVAAGYSDVDPPVVEFYMNHPIQTSAAGAATMVIAIGDSTTAAVNADVLTYKAITLADNVDYVKDGKPLVRIPLPSRMRRYMYLTVTIAETGAETTAECIVSAYLAGKN